MIASALPVPVLLFALTPEFSGLEDIVVFYTHTGKDSIMIRMLLDSLLSYTSEPMRYICPLFICSDLSLTHFLTKFAAYTARVIQPKSGYSFDTFTCKAVMNQDCTFIYHKVLFIFNNAFNSSSLRLLDPIY